MNFDKPGLGRAGREGAKLREDEKKRLRPSGGATLRGPVAGEADRLLLSQFCARACGRGQSRLAPTCSVNNGHDRPIR